MPETRPGPHERRRTEERIAPGLLVWATALASLTVSCGPAREGSEPAASTEWTREGLEEQPRLEQLREGGSASLGYEPGTTPWAEFSWAASAEPPGGLRADSPGALLAQVVGKVGWIDLLGEGVWEQTMRVWTDEPDEAVGVVLQWGLQDDAVAGRDLRVHMSRVEGAWQVERVEQRFHCRRAVSGAGVCV